MLVGTADDVKVTVPAMRREDLLQTRRWPPDDIVRSGARGRCAAVAGIHTRWEVVEIFLHPSGSIGVSISFWSIGGLN